MDILIPLTQGKYALVDSEDFNKLNQWKWHYHDGYAARNSPRNIGKRKKILMHRVIINIPKGKETDHINGNGLDNRRSNLRIVTSSQNGMNTKIRKDNTSGYKGISWDKQRKKWEVYIWVNGQRVVRKLFKELKEAILLRDISENNYHREYKRRIL